MEFIIVMIREMLFRNQFMWYRVLRAASLAECYYRNKSVKSFKTLTALKSGRVLHLLEAALLIK